VAITTIRLREAWNWGGLTARELATRTYEAIDKHETLDRAATVAFWAMLALVPFLGFLLALALGAAGGVAQQVLALSQDFLPPEAHKLVEDQVTKIQRSPPVGVLSLSFVVLLWSSSSLFVSIMDATNAAYGVRDGRPWWKRRLLAIVLTVVEGALLVGASILIVAGPYLLGWLGLGWVASAVATGVQWLVVVVALLASFSIAYYFGPHVEQEWEWITPGATLGVLVLIAASLGFRVYLLYGSSYSETYGALAGVVLLMLWLYLASLSLLVGAEINCVIEHAAPHGRAPGQKVAPQSERQTQPA
jgi:membrane protein